MRIRPQLAAALLLCSGAAACQRKLPGPSSSVYQEAVGSFYTGLAAVQVGESGVAEAAFRRVTELVPEEPAAWADLGLVALQQEQLDTAAARLERARSLAPENGRIALLSALVARTRGNLDEATKYLRDAVRLDPRNLQALYLLARTLEEAGGPGSTAEAQQQLERILAVQPGNLVALLERARLAASAGDRATLAQALDAIQSRLEVPSASTTTQLRAVREAAAAGDFVRAATQTALLETELEPLPAYQGDRAAVVISPGRSDVVLTRFVRLATPVPRASPPDTAIRFVAEPLAGPSGPHAWLQAVWLSDATPLALLSADRRSLWVASESERARTYPFPGGDSGMPSPNAVAPLDYDYDFRVDLALAGGGGLRLLHQDPDGGFTNATAGAIPTAVARGAYAGAWAVDLDMDGDLDLVVAREAGPPLLLTNRGDGRFERRPGFEGVSRLRQFAWADLDADGAPDAVLLDAAGRLHVFRNRRGQQPQFGPVLLPDTLGPIQALTVADLDKDAILDLVLLRDDGTLGQLSLNGPRATGRALGRWPDFTPAGADSTRLLGGDLDNNGDLDLVASTPAGSRVWLAGAGGLRPLPPLADRVTDVADLGGSGRLDLLGASPRGTVVWLANRGTTDYYSTTIRPRAASATGDRRINPFGIGGEIELRAGLLYQKQLITSPTVHFGLGSHADINVARIIWPNGTSQAEFDLSATNQSMMARQRLKGSCPWVFAFDGSEMRFVTDFIWRTALGLRINAQGKTTVIHSEDWVRIRGDQLVARDGYYDIRITAELWESHFFDHVELMAVDHPKDTKLYVDERFKLPPPPLALYPVEPLHAVAGAWDQAGHDVSAIVRDRDGRYVDSFPLGPYQGIARDHWVEIALGDDAPTDGPLWLVASGWIYPTDASINVAISQGGQPQPHGIRLEVADGHGGWRVADPDLGMPSGKTKTILVDLQHRFPPGAPRRLRLRTNMEIYWDRIAWSAGRPDTPLRVRRLLPTTAVLRYRGFSRVHTRRRSEPEVPDYEIAGSGQRWRDLVGYYTRYGDVRALNEKADDRYIIMNAGDELRFRFPALPPPAAGWTRDFVLVGDGWAKDGDYNTGFSRTLLPLPYHGLSDYSRAPGRLEDDPGYRRHPQDWTRYQTRYVAPQAFYRALAPDRGP